MSTSTPAPNILFILADQHNAMTKGTATRIDVSEAWCGMQFLMGIYQSAQKQGTLKF